MKMSKTKVFNIIINMAKVLLSLLNRAVTFLGLVQFLGVGIKEEKSIRKTTSGQIK